MYVLIGVYIHKTYSTFVQRVDNTILRAKTSLCGLLFISYWCGLNQFANENTQVITVFSSFTYAQIQGGLL